MIYFYLFTIACIVCSLLIDRKKTYKALKIAWKKFENIFPAFLTMLILISILLYLVPDKIIYTYLGKSGQFKGIVAALAIGSITIMPGFVAFPLCGILLKQRVSYMSIAAFSTALMLVGVVTFPIEKKYFGTKVTVIRNIICFFIALIVAILIGIVYKEIFI